MIFRAQLAVENIFLTMKRNVGAEVSPVNNWNYKIALTKRTFQYANISLVDNILSCVHSPLFEFSLILFFKFSLRCPILSPSVGGLRFYSSVTVAMQIGVRYRKKGLRRQIDVYCFKFGLQQPLNNGMHGIIQTTFKWIVFGLLGLAYMPTKENSCNGLILPQKDLGHFSVIIQKTIHLNS